MVVIVVVFAGAEWFVVAVMVEVVVVIELQL